MYPKARNENLLIHIADDELVIYDRSFKTAHRLSPSAALVWKHLDGTRSLANLAELVAREHELEPTLSELLVLKAIGLFERVNLLQTNGDLSSREVFSELEEAGPVAAYLPVVKSIPAPWPKMPGSLPPFDNGDFSVAAQVLTPGWGVS